VNETSPAKVAVPLICPPLLRIKPTGSVPTEIDQLYGVVPPLAASDPEYALFTCPPGREDVVIVGGTKAAFTVSVAAALVTVPAVLLTTTSKVDPLSAVVVTGVV